MDRSEEICRTCGKFNAPSTMYQVLCYSDDSRNIAKGSIPTIDKDYVCVKCVMDRYRQHRANVSVHQ